MNYTSVSNYLYQKGISYQIQSGGAELVISCPFCKHQVPKLYVNASSGLWHCFHASCGESGVFKYLQERLGSKDDEVTLKESKPDEGPELPPIDPQVIEDWHTELLKHDSLLKWLNDRHLNNDTIKKFEIGWTGKALAIPIKNMRGEVVNVKFRSDPTYPTAKKAMWHFKDRKIALFNEVILKDKPEEVIICEGEWDCILLDQLGFNAVTSSGGAGSFRKEWVEGFKGISQVWTCFDRDRNNAGQKGSLKLGKLFKEQGVMVQNILLPEPESALDEKVDVTDYFVKLGKTKDDFKLLIGKTPNNISSTNYTIDTVMERLNTYWLNPDRNAIRIIFASLVAFKLESDPLWIFIIAPPSSLKTEFISGLGLIPDVYKLSSLTPQTLASGLRVKGKENHSLLTKIGSKVLAFKDFTTVLSGRWEDLQKILAQLREVYDGEFIAEYGTGIKVEWKGKMSFVAGVTQIIDQHSTVAAMLGERFIQYRMKGVDEIEVALAAQEKANVVKIIRKNVKEIFRDFHQSLNIPASLDDIELSRDFMIKIANLCAFVVKARSGTKRDSYRKELEYIPDPEAPARLAGQLSILARCLAVVDRQTKVADKQFNTVAKVALDCIPRQRLATLLVLFKPDENGNLPKFSTPETSELIGYSTPATKIFLEDLNAFGLVDVDKSGKAHKWNVSEQTVRYLENSICLRGNKITNQNSSRINVYKLLLHISDVKNREKIRESTDTIRVLVGDSETDSDSVQVGKISLKNGKKGKYEKLPVL